MISDQYLAGLFDGEGCIDLQRMYAKPPYDKKLYVRPRIRICMSDNVLFLAARLQAEFGGHITARKASGKAQQSSWTIEWLSRETIIVILGRILPHLILKKEQAKLALWWMETASGRSNQSSIKYGIDEMRTVLVEEMRALKREPLRTAECSIERIQNCAKITYDEDMNVVRIR